MYPKGDFSHWISHEVVEVLNMWVVAMLQIIILKLTSSRGISGTTLNNNNELI